MRKGLLTFLLTVCTFAAHAQDVKVHQQPSFSVEEFPVFPKCENLKSKELEKCFYNEVQDFVFQNFVVPEDLVQNKYKGNVKVLFEVDKEGVFKVIYVNAGEDELVKEAKRVFAKLPQIKPSTYNGNPSFSQYNFTIAIPLKSSEQIAAETAVVVAQTTKVIPKPLTELDSIVYKKFNNPQYSSHLNVPFSHSYYAHFDAALNQVGANNHTASKPFTYVEVAKYYNLVAENEKIKKN